ncbi:MAG: DUF2784 domain-containing protein [Casimicrobiaceae bacterium]
MHTLIWSVLADGLALAHALFVVFVVGGALVVRWRPWLAWLHLPCLAWVVLLELNSWICPLTPWEQTLRRAAREGGYEGGFVDHYVMPVLYPTGLTADVQMVLAVLVLAINAGLYGWLLRAHWRRRPSP